MRLRGMPLDAPEEVLDEAIIRNVGYLYDRPDASNPFVLSGAKAMLARWHGLVSSLVGSAPPPVAMPETNLNPSHPVHTGTHFRYAGWSDDGVVSQAELDAAAQFTGDVLTSAQPGDQLDTSSLGWTRYPVIPTLSCLTAIHEPDHELP